MDITTAALYAIVALEIRAISWQGRAAERHSRMRSALRDGEVKHAIDYQKLAAEAHTYGRDYTDALHIFQTASA